MRHISVLMMAIGLTACGIPKQMSKDCGGTFELGCKVVFGDSSADEQRESAQNSDISELKSRVSALEGEMNVQISNSQAVSAEISFLQTLIDNLSADTLANQAQIVNLQSAVSVNTSQLSLLQVQMNNTLINLAQLQAQNTVTELIDFCGPGPGYNEVGLRMKSGETVAYFENGGQRHLVTLTPGSYVTTDGTNCFFSVNSQLKVCDTLGCR